MIKSGWMAALVVLVSLAGACDRAPTGPKIEVQEPWTRAVAGMAGHSGSGESGGDQESTMALNGAAYMLLRNTGNEADRLLRAESQAAQAVELHVSEMKDGVMQMRPVAFVEVPAGGQTELKPGGFHVMLIGLKHELVPGDKLTLLLEFEKSGEITVEAEVREP